MAMASSLPLVGVLGAGGLGEQGGQASGERSQGASELKGCGRVGRIGMDFCKVRSESGPNYRIY